MHFLPSSDTVCDTSPTTTKSKIKIPTYPHHAFLPKPEKGPDTPYEPTSSTSLNVVNVHSTTSTPHPLPPPTVYTSNISSTVRAQIDTGADITCTNLIDVIHNYKPYTKEFPCQLKLVGAINSTEGVYPHGEGYLHVPAANDNGYTRVRCIYSPTLSSTLISEDDFIRSNPKLKLRDYTIEIYKFHDTNKLTIRCKHRLDDNKTIIIHGVISFGKSYTQPLIMPDLLPHPPRATPYNSLEQALSHDEQFAKNCFTATVNKIHVFQKRVHDHITKHMHQLPCELPNHSVNDWTFGATPINVIKAQTQRLLWHQRLGHINDDYLYNAHKFIDGIPKFKHNDPILDKCPTCIQSKQTKTPAGPNTTRTAEHPFQGLSIDFSFSGTKSKDTNRTQDYEGINGETSWILISDHFTRFLTGDTRLSKASPITWLQKFLETNAPNCSDKYVQMDQGGELYHNPEVRKLFTRHGYQLRPTGADSSHQNGPVERAHRTVCDRIRCLLSGARLPIKFWPYAFHHALRILNAIPQRTQTQSPLQLVTGKKENLRNFKTFGCRVWVRPPGRRSAKFKNNSRKGIFLGYLPQTTKNILWYDIETDCVKIASHARFDEGMNDLPIDAIPPNIIHLQRSENGSPIPPDDSEIEDIDLNFHISPFQDIMTKEIHVKCKSPTFGLQLDQDELNGRVFLKDVTKKSSAATMFSTWKATRNKVRGAYIVSINDQPVFDKQSALNVLESLVAKGTTEFEIKFAPVAKASSVRRWKEIDEYNLHAPTDKFNTTAQINYAALRAITAIRTGTHIPPNIVSDEMIRLVINALTSQTTTKEEEALGHFTRRKLKQLNNWNEWLHAERKQLDQFHDLEMYGKPTPRPPKSILLRPHWQYQVRKTGERRSRNCCDGSKRSAPLLHAIASTYSSCVEQPVQRLFFALTAILNYKLYAGDAKDAYAHSPPPEVPTFVAIDGQYADWYKWKFDEHLNPSHVLPVQHALQGHPESGRLWEEHINKILFSKELRFTTTTHDKCIYQTTYKDTKILMLRQVDDFLISSPNATLANEIYDIIGKKLQLPKEKNIPFKNLGLATSYNGVDIKQTKHYIEISCEDYIDRVARSHGWTTPKDELLSHPTAPLPEKALDKIFDEDGPPEGSSEHKKLKELHGFPYRTLLGEILYAYNVCRPDIGFAVSTMSKFSLAPSDLHFKYLKGVALYLRRTKTWGLRYRKTNILDDDVIPDGTFNDPPIPLPDTLPPFPSLPTDATITCLVDAAYANIKPKRKSTTGLVVMLANAAIVYKSKTQSQTAQSSTEAEFYAAVSAAKIVLYLRSILADLGFPQNNPTTLYEDNDSTIKIVNSGVPTERSRHIDIPYFAIQDWKRDLYIKMQFISGKINPADALTKPLGWVLHNRHVRRLFGHFTIPHSQ